jgi:hypothetical protein
VVGASGIVQVNLDGTFKTVADGLTFPTAMTFSVTSAHPTEISGYHYGRQV